MAPDNADDRPGPTPVPPRGGKRKPNRPPAKRPAGARPGAPARSSRSSRPADNRRAALTQQRRRKQTFLAGGAVVVIIAVIVVFIVARGSGGAKSNTTTAPVAAGSLDSFTSAVSLQEMKAAAANYPLDSETEGAYAGYPTIVSDPPITSTGKPEVLYVGAEYCPYCATERWPIVLALSKFGTFHNLSSIHSSASDVFPSTPTFAFYKSTYTSPYLTFTSVETTTVDRNTPLQVLTKAQQALVDKYDNGGSIPFVYFNGKAIISGAEYNPALLGSGDNGPASKMSFQQIADSIAGGTSKLASSVAADAGAIVAAICHMTGGKPANVCSLFPTPITS